MKKIVVLIIILCNFTSCIMMMQKMFQKVERWPEGGEKETREIRYEHKQNIFDDFLWTTPPVYSNELEVVGRLARFNFKDEEYVFMIDSEGKTASLKTPDGIKVYSDFYVSTKDYYFDINQLDSVWVTRYRWVSKTEMVMKTVPVTKTRTVPQTTFDIEGRPTTTMRTEVYTDYETRWVPETRWVWESYRELFIDIPQYKYFVFQISDKSQILIYVIPSGDENRYYMQNPSYISVEDTEEGFIREKDIKILFIDSNSNGYYFDDTDRVLFNTWNPYEESSKYVSISGFMHNKWYSVSNLKDERFLEFEINEETGRIKFINANSKYVGIKKTGRLEISNTKDCRIFINGKEYSERGDVFNKRIEYGKYYMRIEKEGYLDFEEYFEINEDQPDFNIMYEEP